MGISRNVSFCFFVKCFQKREIDVEKTAKETLIFAAKSEIWTTVVRV